jgi:predicted DCC family thiol-disulfide oxidoreductase YuxK
MPAPVVIFDGECAICNGAIRRVLKFDKQGVFRITGNASEVGKALIARSGLPADITQSSVVVVHGDRSWTRSSAVLQVIAFLPLPWKMAAVARIVPRPARDFVYRQIAKHRRKVEGADAACGIPTPELREQWQRQLATMEQLDRGEI